LHWNYEKESTGQKRPHGLNSKDTDSPWPLSGTFRDKRQVAFMSREGHVCEYLPIAMKETAQEGS
jgi:hypothetical protein